MIAQDPDFWPFGKGRTKPVRTAPALLAWSGKGKLVQDLSIEALWPEQLGIVTAKLNQDQPA